MLETLRQQYNLEKDKNDAQDSQITDLKELIEEIEHKTQADQTDSLPIDDVKKIVARAKAVEGEKNKMISDLLDEKTDLQNKLDKVEVVNEYIGHMNQNQKIKYVLRLKEDNNSMKKQLAKAYNEMSKLSDYSVSDKEKEVFVLSEKVQKQRGDLDKAHDHS